MQTENVKEFGGKISCPICSKTLDKDVDVCPKCDYHFKKTQKKEDKKEEITETIEKKENGSKPPKKAGAAKKEKSASPAKPSTMEVKKGVNIDEMDTDVETIIKTRKAEINSLKNDIEKEEKRYNYLKGKYEAQLKLFEAERERERLKLNRMKDDIAGKKQKVEKDEKIILEKESEIMERVRKLKKDLKSFLK